MVVGPRWSAWSSAVLDLVVPNAWVTMRPGSPRPLHQPQPPPPTLAQQDGLPHQLELLPSLSPSLPLPVLLLLRRPRLPSDRFRTGLMSPESATVPTKSLTSPPQSPKQSSGPRPAADSHQGHQALFPSPRATMLSLAGHDQDQMAVITEIPVAIMVSIALKATHTAGRTGAVMTLLTQAHQFPVNGQTGWQRQPPPPLRPRAPPSAKASPILLELIR